MAWISKFHDKKPDILLGGGTHCTCMPMMYGLDWDLL